MIPSRSIQGQTLLLTGATGFLGSHLVRAFLADGYRVAILKRTGSACSRIEPLLPLLHVFDIEGGLEPPFRTLGRVDAVIHTATCYGRQGESISEVLEANLVFPSRLLEVASSFNTDAFFNTDTVLNKDLNAYALSKHQFMEKGRGLAKAGGIKFFNLKLEHMYGAGDDPSKFTTHVILACLSNLGELKLTTGEQQRDFVHIEDVVSAYKQLLLRAGEFQRGFFELGVGTGKAVSIREFAYIVRRLSGSHTQLMFGAIPYREREVMKSQADVTALSALGWNCRYELEAGIKQVIEKERSGAL